MSVPNAGEHEAKGSNFVLPKEMKIFAHLYVPTC